MFLIAFPTAVLNRRSIGPETRLVEARNELAREQLYGDIVRPLLDLPLVTPARVPDRGGDVRKPVEAPHPFKDLPVGGVLGFAGHDPPQLLVEELLLYSSGLKEK